MAVWTDALTDSVVVYYPCEGHIHLYEVDCLPVKLGEAVVAMRNPNWW